MDFKTYQKETRRTAFYPKIIAGFVYPTLGLVGEAGEVAEKIKKIFRDDDGILTDERKDLIKKELGDVLWYLSQIATEMELDLEDIAQSNLTKLLSRLERDKLTGDGDNR